MDRVIEALVVQSPGVVAVIVVVLMFLKYLKESEAERTKVLHEINTDTHVIQQRCVESLDRNTEMLGRVSQCLDTVEASLKASEKENRNHRSL